MQGPRLHLVGNAHIDPAWLWRWPEGMGEVLSTFRSALDRIAEHPTFVFSCGSAAFYEFTERADPAMFEEIVGAVDGGRWEILGGYWVEPDTNLSSGEALVRHAVISQRYFASRFGRVPTVAFNPDAFGQSAGLPQILSGSGFDAYVFMRPDEKERELPTSFRWESADGSSVLAYRIPVSYCTWAEALAPHLAAVRTVLGAEGLEEGMCFYGVGNHGGGPTRANLADLDARIAGGEPLAFSSPHKFLSGRTPAASVEGELGYHARGAYSADSAVKRETRRADAALIEAESAATLASVLVGSDYPAEELQGAWKALLCAGFHDVAAGTVIRSAQEDALGALRAVASTARRIADDAYVTLAWQTSLEVCEDETALVVFNPHPWRTTSAVEAEVGVGDGRLLLTDDVGNRLPVQEIGSEALSAGRRRITFLAELPACGWSAFRLRTHPGRAETGALPEPSCGSRWQIELHRETGGLETLSFDGEAVFPGPSAYATVAADPSDTWSHGVSSYHPAHALFVGDHSEVLEDGPVRLVLRSVSRHGSSTLTQKFYVYRGLDRALVEVVCDWAERHKVLKLRFPKDRDATVQMEAPYSTVARAPDGEEYPGGSWLVAGGAGGGYCIANDAKFGYDVLPQSLGITVVRSPVAAHHEPASVVPGAELDFLDQGSQRFVYSIGTRPDPLMAARMAAELLRPSCVVLGSHHPRARLGAGRSHLELEGATLGALKRSEDGSGTVLRAHNPSLSSSRVTVNFGGRSTSAALAPTGLRTFYFPDAPGEPVSEIALTEHEVAASPSWLRVPLRRESAVSPPRLR
jgi:alpha-mannosidase